MKKCHIAIYASRDLIVRFIYSNVEGEMEFKFAKCNRKESEILDQKQASDLVTEYNMKLIDSFDFFL